MNNKVYVVAFDTPPNGTDALHKAIDSNAEITAWWHYINNTYLLVTRERATTIYDKLSAASGGTNMLIIEVNQNGSRQGWLPNKAWEWIDANLSRVSQ